MNTLRENVETFLNLSRGLKAAIAVAEEIQSIDRLEQMIGEAHARLAKAVNRESELAQANHDLAVTRMELETLNANVAKAREVWSQLMGSNPA
jgi:outer membrane protein TolC